MARKAPKLKVTLTYSDNDWLGVYFDGQLVYEGHSLRARELLELLEGRGVLDYEDYCFSKAEEAYLDDVGNLPEKLSSLDDGSWMKERGTDT